MVSEGHPLQTYYTVENVLQQKRKVLVWFHPDLLVSRCCPVFIGGSSYPVGIGTSTSERWKTELGFYKM